MSPAASSGHRLPRLRDGDWTVAVALAVIVLCAALPVGRLIAAALSGGWTPFIEAIGGRSARAATWNTIHVSLLGTLVALAVGLAYALPLALLRVPGRRALALTFLLPTMIAPQISALAWLQLLGPSSALLAAFGLAPEPGSGNPLYGRGGIVLLLGLEQAPIVFLAAIAGLRAVPRDLVDAARAAGAAPLRALTTIVLPLAAPHIGAGAALAFAANAGNFGIPAFLGPPVGFQTLTTLIYERLASFGPAIVREMAALAVVVAAIAAVGLASHRLLTRRARAELSGPGLAPVDAGTWGVAASALLWLGIALLFVAPFVALVATSLVPALGVPLGPATITFHNYAEVLLRQDATPRAFRNSLALAAGAAAILALLAMPLAYALARRRLALVRLMDSLIDLPFALPGIVLAVAMVLLFLRPLPLVGLSLYGTFGIILVAYLCRFLPLAVRPVEAAMRQLPMNVEEAAAMAGAGFARRLRTIVVPLAAPSIAAGALMVFLTAFNELTVSALLWSSGTETVGVVLYSLEDAGLTPLSAAVAVVTLMVVATGLVILDRIAGRLPPGAVPWRS